MRLHTDFFEKLHEKFPTMKEDAVIEGFYKFLKDITIESNIDYPREIDISTVTGTSIKFTDTKGNTIGIIEPVKKENFNHGIQLRVADQVLGLFISDEHIATAIAPTPVPMQEGGNPKSIVTLDSFKQLAIYTLEELGLSFTENGFIETDKGDNSLSSVGFVKQQLEALKQEILAIIGVEIPPPTPETPEYITPEGVIEGILSPYALKVRFTDDWYSDPGTFYMRLLRGGWKEATKIVDNVVYFIFTEEEVVSTRMWFEKHKPVKEPNEESMTHNTIDYGLKFEDTIMDDVVILDRQDIITVGSAYI